MPDVIVWPAMPLSKVDIQPRPWSSMSERFRLFANVAIGAGAVGFAEGVAASDERDGLFVVHGHAAEGFANVFR